MTRTAPDNSSTARHLAALGHDPVCAPVLEVRPIASEPLGFEVDAIVFTSRNGVRHHPPSPDLFDRPVFAVGSRTAEAASAVGYRDVRSAAGDVRQLQQLIVRDLRTPSSIVHFGARDAAGDLKGVLERCGHRFQRRIVYATVPARTLEGLGELSKIEAIMVHSPRGARRVVKALSRTGWQGVVWCISEACAMRLTDLPHLEIHFAGRPEEDALIDLVRQHRVERLRHRPALRLVGGLDLVGFPGSKVRALNDNLDSEYSRRNDDDDPQGDPSPAA